MNRRLTSQVSRLARIIERNPGSSETGHRLPLKSKPNITLQGIELMKPFLLCLAKTINSLSWEPDNPPRVLGGYSLKAACVKCFTR